MVRVALLGESLFAAWAALAVARLNISVARGPDSLVAKTAEARRSALVSVVEALSAELSGTLICDPLTAVADWCGPLADPPGRAPKAASTRTAPAKQNQSKTRKLKKADLEEDFFFIVRGLC